MRAIRTAGGGAGVSDGKGEDARIAEASPALSTIHAFLQHLDRWVREHHQTGALDETRTGGGGGSKGDEGGISKRR